MEDDKKLIRYKWVLYIALFAVICILENSTIISNIKIFGSSPSLLPFALSVIAMFEGSVGGAGAGLAAGLMMDAICTTEGFYTITYTVCAILVSLFNTLTFHESYPVSLLLWLMTVVISAILYYVFFILLLGNGGPAIIFKMLPGEIVASIIFTPIVYLLLRYIHRRFTPDRR